MEGTILSDRVLEGYDYIVIGSGFTALAFIKETLRLRPHCRILCIERGDNNYASHYEELLQHARSKIGHSMATPDVIPNQCPWHVTAATSSSEELNSCAGACFLLGGRSNYWYGWCMQPPPEQLRGFPAMMKQATRDPQFWRRASKLLGVVKVNQLGPIYFDCLQCIIERRLDDLALQVPTFQDTRPACFASPMKTGGGFLRYSVAEQLQRMATPSTDYKIPALDILLNHTVTRLQHTMEGGSVHSISTHQGCLRLSEPNTKVVLCAGAIPNATLLLNSFPHLTEFVGKHISGHFRSHIFARVPASAFILQDNSFAKRKQWGLAARVISGRDQQTDHQFHIQLSAFYCPQYRGRYQEIHADLPRYGTVPVEAHLQGLGHDVIISCAALGELSEDNPRCWLKLNAHADPISNVDLQFLLSSNDRSLWDLMDNATFQAIEATAGGSRDLRFWSEDRQDWIREQPRKRMRRSPMLVHEAGSTPMSDDDDCSGALGKHFNVRGCDNVYVTGSGILPTAGSWNPTLTICGYAQELARILEKEGMNQK